MQGAGKTTLLKAVLKKCKPNTAINEDAVSEDDVREVIADGLCYCDSTGINMQVFHFWLLSDCSYYSQIKENPACSSSLKYCLLYGSKQPNVNLLIDCCLY